jgi:hypothetical protein
MRIAFNQHAIQLEASVTSEQLHKRLALCQEGRLLLGEENPLARKCSLIEILIERDPKHRFGVGLCHEGHGLAPYLLFQPGLSRFLIGFDWTVAGVNVPDGDLVINLPLDSVFYSFLQIPNSDMVLIQHETGLIMLAASGDSVWRFDKDIITTLNIEEDRVQVEFMDSPTVELGLSTGQRV